MASFMNKLHRSIERGATRLQEDGSSRVRGCSGSSGTVVCDPGRPGPGPGPGPGLRDFDQWFGLLERLDQD